MTTLRHCPLCNQLDCCDPDCPDHILREMGVGFEPKTKNVEPIRRENKPQPVAKPGEF